jgi:GH43 family beta-xylosidase
MRTLSFANPIIPSRDAADPWVIRWRGDYYFTGTLDPEGGLWVWRSPTLTGLDGGEKVRVWKAPCAGPQSRQIWAPELHFLHGSWYLYYTASDGVDAQHRHYLLRATTEDPLGPYEDLGRVDPAFEQYAIDGSVLELPDGRLFFLYAAGGLFIAPMRGPTRVSGTGVKIAGGTCEWERAWRRPPVAGAEWIRAEGYWLEAPQALVREGRVYLVYSAGHSATPHYCLGLLTLAGSDPMDPAAWVKSPEPVFGPYEGAEGAVYTVGHCCFTRSPDGAEDWIVCHAKDSREPGFAGRTARAQSFGWKPDGTPDFGRPVPAGVPLPRPSGEPAVLEPKEEAHAIHPSK